MTETTPPASPQQSASQPPRAPRWKRWLVRGGITLAILLVVMSIMAVSSEYYTSRPEFCASCHIMHPYYEGWSQDVHASSKARAICVDCHYAPGQHHTLMAKFRGLSQVASYFTGRYGASRPRAHVSTASCLTSECHGDQSFMDKVLHVGSITFVHAKHLNPKSEMLTKAVEEMTAARAKLVAEIGPETVGQIDRIAGEMGPVSETNAALANYLESAGLAAYEDEAAQYVELVHVDLRVDHLRNLQCASCHQFDPTLHDHFAVAKTTCYTCHFMNQPFNAGTGRCLSCHEPPTGPIAIHGTTAPTAAGMPASAATVTMDHTTILENNVDCVSCHSDLLHGTGKVTLRECQNCHDQARFTKDFAGATLKTVREYHKVHAAGQYARCNDCHAVIDHHLLPAITPSDTGSLLEPVRADCQHCHPNHHEEQVEMLLGRGGYSGDLVGLPNQMAGARASCRACHTASGEDVKGDLVITSTLTSCRGCHGNDYEKLFDEWKHAIHARLEEAQTLHDEAEAQLAAAQHLPDAQREAAMKLIRRAGGNIHLVASANGIHNKNYALVLLDQAIADLDAATAQLTQ